jgi:hypothetical protein
MKKLLLSSLLVFVLMPSFSSQAQDDSCFMILSSGKRVNLGGLCGQSSSPRQFATHTFPDWLIKDDAKTAKIHETGTKHTDKASNWVYDNRFVLAFRDYPYTASATNHAEWLYVDCFSGWQYYKNYPFVKDSREYATAPNDESINKAVPQRLEGLRSLCKRMGVSPRF